MITFKTSSLDTFLNFLLRNTLSHFLKSPTSLFLINSQIELDTRVVAF